MGTDSTKKLAATPLWFLVYAGLMVLWYALGVVQLALPYIISEPATAEPLDPGLQIMRAEPLWATVGYSLGIVAGFVGAVLMLRHPTRRVSRVFWVVSILGFLTQRAWFFLLSGLTHLLPQVAYATLFIPVVLGLIAIWMVSRALRIAEQSSTA